jgi:FkbM family methyltransferase
MPIDQDKIMSQLEKSIRDVNKPVIVDIGAYTGHLALKLCKNLKDYRVYCIEACKKNFKVLSNETKDDDRISSHHIAIASYDGIARFYVAKSEKTKKGSSQANSLYKKFLESKDWARIKEKEIECMTLDTFCSENDIDKIDCLKINCEGCEFDIFDSPTKKFLEITSVLYVEMHGKCNQFNSNSFCNKKKEIINCLGQYNFEMISGDNDINSKTHIRQLWVKKI